MADEAKLEIEQRVKTMDEKTLRERRSELVRLSRTKAERPDGLDPDELTELCAIYSRLRGEKGGPPTDATVTKRAAAKVNILEDIDLP
jgi:hypothetical protein